MYNTKWKKIKSLRFAIVCLKWWIKKICSCVLSIRGRHSRSFLMNRPTVGLTPPAINMSRPTRRGSADCRRQRRPPLTRNYAVFVWWWCSTSMSSRLSVRSSIIQFGRNKRAMLSATVTSAERCPNICLLPTPFPLSSEAPLTIVLRRAVHHYSYHGRVSILIGTAGFISREAVGL